MNMPKFGVKKFFAFGVDANNEAVLVICDSVDDAILEKERLKQSDCVRVSYTGKPIEATMMIGKAKTMYPGIAIRYFSPKVPATS